MEVLYLVVPLALVFASCAALAYIWAVHHGQFDDMSTPAHKILLDDESADSD